MPGMKKSVQRHPFVSAFVCPRKKSTVEGRKTVRRAIVPVQVHLLLLLPGYFGSSVRRWAQVVGKSSNERKTSILLRNADVLHVRVRRLESLVGLQRCPFLNKCEELERQQEPPSIYGGESQGETLSCSPQYEFRQGARGEAQECLICLSTASVSCPITGNE
jgi:hypothetical protein